VLLAISSGVGAAGASSGTSAGRAAMKVAAAANRPGASIGRRWVITPPFETPVTWTRRGSAANAATTVSASAVMKATSSAAERSIPAGRRSFQAWSSQGVSPVRASTPFGATSRTPCRRATSTQARVPPAVGRRIRRMLWPPPWSTITIGAAGERFGGSQIRDHRTCPSDRIERSDHRLSGAAGAALAARRWPGAHPSTTAAGTIGAIGRLPRRGVVSGLMSGSPRRRPGRQRCSFRWQVGFRATTSVRTTWCREMPEPEAIRRSHLMSARQNHGGSYRCIGVARREGHGACHVHHSDARGAGPALG
jgi:hypothetical protein